MTVHVGDDIGPTIKCFILRFLSECLHKLTESLANMKSILGRFLDSFKLDKDSDVDLAKRI